MNRQQGETLIQRFLRLMEDRDLETANTLIAPDARIMFPGGKIFDSQAEMVAASKGRYEWVKKTFDHIDSTKSAGGDVVVYIMGTLYGVNKYGIEFSGVRYIDRFVVREGLIISQEVWNDLAESEVLDKKA
jgi:hypothetical protein